MQRDGIFEFVTELWWRFKFCSMLHLTDVSNDPRKFRLLDPEDGSTMNIRNVANFTSWHDIKIQENWVFAVITVWIAVHLSLLSSHFQILPSKFYRQFCFFTCLLHPPPIQNSVFVLIRNSVWIIPVNAMTTLPAVRPKNRYSIPGR